MDTQACILGTQNWNEHQWKGDMDKYQKEMNPCSSHSNLQKTWLIDLLPPSGRAKHILLIVEHHAGLFLQIRVCSTAQLPSLFPPCGQPLYAEHAALRFGFDQVKTAPAQAFWCATRHTAHISFSLFLIAAASPLNVFQSRSCRQAACFVLTGTERRSDV